MFVKTDKIKPAIFSGTYWSKEGVRNTSLKMESSLLDVCGNSVLHNDSHISGGFTESLEGLAET